MTTTQKLWLGFGLLLVLLVGSGLFVARRLALVEQALVTIMAVQEPATAATYEMAVNVSSTISGVVGYVDTGAQQTRSQVDSLRVAFVQLKREYDRIARSTASRRLGGQIAFEHDGFAALGDSLMNSSESRREDAEAFARRSDELTRLIEDNLTNAVDPHERDAQRRYLLVSQLDADVTAVAASIGHFLRTRDPGHESVIAARELRYHDTVRQLRGMPLTTQEQAALARVDHSFDQFDKQGGRVIERVAELRSKLERYLGRGNQVMRLVDEGIHSLARNDLIEAQQAARQALHTSLIAVLVLLVAGIVIGSITAFPTGRSIVLAEKRIREQTVQLRTQMEDLERAHRNKDEFLGVLGHELRNPLAPVSNALHVLAKSDTTAAPEVREAHEMMRRQVRNLSRLVDDLLDVSRINEGKITLRRGPVDLGVLCRDAVRDVQPAADARHQQFTHTCPDAGPWVDADATRLAQVVSNLLYNAVKYTPEGGAIRLGVEAKDGEAVLRVTDNGIGIAPDMRARIFEPFVQGGATTVPPQGGLGIGLTLARRLVELHGGRVEVQSAGEGFGSTFTVRLPLLATPPLAVAPPASSVRATSRQVLVVDDNRDAAETLGALIEMWGHSVHVVHDGAAAVDAAVATHPDVVLLDIGLPGMDGYGVVSRLRTLPATRDATIIAMTGYGQESDRKRALAAGFDAHMAKPVDPDALRDLLARNGH